VSIESAQRALDAAMENLVEEYKLAGKPFFPEEAKYQGFAAVAYCVEFDDEGHSLTSTASVYSGGDMLIHSAIGLYQMHVQDLLGSLRGGNEHLE
jgi:hypothetical protein